MKRFKSKKGLVALLAVVALAIAAVGAYAYWTTSGTGTGTAPVGNIAASLHVTQTSDTGPSFSPGGTGQVLGGTVESTIASGGAHVAVQTLVAKLDSVTGGLGPNCNTSDFAFTTSSGWILSTTTTPNDTATFAFSPVVDLAPLATTSWSGLNVAMVNKTTVNQDDCKTATLNFAYSAS